MTDSLPAWDKCPVGKRGRHHIDCLWNGNEETGEGVLTFLCQQCGMLTRIASTGALVPIDSLSADEIERRILGFR